MVHCSKYDWRLKSKTFVFDSRTGLRRLYLCVVNHTWYCTTSKLYFGENPKIYLITFQQVTVLAHPKQTSMLHRFLLRPPLQELHLWALPPPPHQLRTWAKLPLGSLTSLIASMVRKALCIKQFAALFSPIYYFIHPPALTISLDILLDATTPHISAYLQPLDKQELALGTI